MKCPDCKTYMDAIEYNSEDEELMYPYYKCPKCGIEVEDEEDKDDE